MAILTSKGSFTGKQYSAMREAEKQKKNVEPYSLEQLSKDINSGAVTTQDQLNEQVYNRGYTSNVTGNIAPSTPSYAPRLSGNAPSAAVPTALGSSGTKGQAPATVGGKTANSAGSYYGAAGTNTMATSFDAAGNPILGTMGGRNIIGGGDSVVDRTPGIGQDPMSQYMAMFSPTAAIDRQKEIRKQLAKERRQQIDAIEMSANQAVSAEQAAGAQDLARQRSVNLRSGLGGSDFGASSKAEIRTRTNENVRGIEAQKT